MSLEGVNRARPAGFMRYWMENPVHFKMAFGAEATKQNVETAFADLRRRALVVAAEPPLHCTCELCKMAEDKSKAYNFPTRQKRMRKRKRDKNNA